MQSCENGTHGSLVSNPRGEGKMHALGLEPSWPNGLLFYRQRR